LIARCLAVDSVWVPTVLRPTTTWLSSSDMVVYNYATRTWGAQGEIVVVNEVNLW
jgi:hypothetical protein